MAISTPVNLGFIGNASTPSSLSITTSAAVSSGDTIIMWHYANGGNSFATGTVTDSSSNTYHTIISSQASAPLLEIFVCYNAASMASSSSITIPSFANSALRHGMSAWKITGLLNTNGGIPIDPHTTGTANVVQGNTGTSSASIPINNSYSNIMLFAGIVTQGSTAGTVTQGGSFTTLGGGTTNAFMYPAYQIVASASGVTYAPSWTSTGSAMKCACIALPGLPATNTSRQAQGTLCGVGA